MMKAMMVEQMVMPEMAMVAKVMVVSEAEAEMKPRVVWVVPVAAVAIVWVGTPQINQLSIHHRHILGNLTDGQFGGACDVTRDGDSAAFAVDGRIEKPLRSCQKPFAGVLVIDWLAPRIEFALQYLHHGFIWLGL